MQKTIYQKMENYMLDVKVPKIIIKSIQFLIFKFMSNVKSIKWIKYLSKCVIETQNDVVLMDWMNEWLLKHDWKK